MNEAMSDLIGQQIRVFASTPRIGSHYSEVGTLESYDHPWLRLRRDDGTLQWYSAYNINMVELRYGVFEDLPESGESEESESFADSEVPQE